MNKPQYNRRELPTKFKGMMSVDWFRRFTFKERLKILFGYNLVVAARIATQHSPGIYEPRVAAQTTKLISPDDQMKLALENEVNELIDNG